MKFCAFSYTIIKSIVSYHHQLSLWTSNHKCSFQNWSIKIEKQLSRRRLNNNLFWHCHHASQVWSDSISFFMKIPLKSWTVLQIKISLTSNLKRSNFLVLSSYKLNVSVEVPQPLRVAEVRLQVRLPLPEVIRPQIPVPQRHRWQCITASQWRILSRKNQSFTLMLLQIIVDAM